MSVLGNSDAFIAMFWGFMADHKFVTYMTQFLKKEGFGANFVELSSGKENFSSI